MRKIISLLLFAALILIPVFCYASVNVNTETVTASSANGFKAVLLGLIGDYETIVTDYTNPDGVHSISIERDWSWIFSCICFIVVVYCFFRAIGGLMKW